MMTRPPYLPFSDDPPPDIPGAEDLPTDLPAAVSEAPDPDLERWPGQGAPRPTYAPRAAARGAPAWIPLAIGAAALIAAGGVVWALAGGG